MELGVSRYTTSIFPTPSPAWCYFPSFGFLQHIKECSIFSTLFLHELLVSSSHGLPVSSCSCLFFVSKQKMQTQTNPLRCKKLNKMSKTQIKNVSRDSLALLKIEALECKKMQHPVLHNSRMLCSEQIYFNNVDIYHGLQALTLVYPYGLINMKVETKRKTRWNATMKLPRTSLFPETIAFQPLLSALRRLCGENHVPQSHFALPAKDRL